MKFQSTCPARGTTRLILMVMKSIIDFNPRAPRGARHDYPIDYTPDVANISIHVPREGHDISDADISSQSVISIHVPREGHDDQFAEFIGGVTQFQSTCPARGTTDTYHDNYLRFGISIHVPREGHDCAALLSLGVESHLFQSTCPARGTTREAPGSAEVSTYFNPRAPRGARRCREQRKLLGVCISIHVPREGHDTTLPIPHIATDYFNPRAPRGARHIHRPQRAAIGYFNPRAPRGARQITTLPVKSLPVISIHVPREGHDIPGSPMYFLLRTFQSTCPARGTTANMHNFFVQICAKVTTIPLKGMPYTRKMHVSL